MTKSFTAFIAAILFFSPSFLMAEDSAVVATDTVVAQAEKVADEITAPEIAPIDTPTAVLALADAPLDVTAPTTMEEAPPLEPISAPIIEAPVVIAEAIPTDNLEFISGEISSADETTQSVMVKLYGETESGTSDKTLKVTVDGTTDITDGEQDRDLKSLTAGTEVDVEYDPATNKATYIFVY